MRFSVTKSHGIGYHIRTPYETKEIASSTLDKWIREYANKVKNNHGFGSVFDKREDNGTGTIEFEYFVNGCLNREMFTIEQAG